MGRPEEAGRSLRRSRRGGAGGVRGLQPTRGGHPSRRHRCHSSCCSQGALVVKSPPASAADVRDTGSIPGSGRSRGGGHGNPLQYSCLENLMDRGAWRAAVHGVVKSRTRLKRPGMNTHSCAFSGTSVHLILPEAPGWARFTMSTGGPGSEASPHSPPAGRCRVGGSRGWSPGYLSLSWAVFTASLPSFACVELPPRGFEYKPLVLTSPLSQAAVPPSVHHLSLKETARPRGVRSQVLSSSGTGSGSGDTPSSAWLPGVYLPIPTTLCQCHWPDVDPREPGCFRHQNGVFRLTSLLQSGGRKDPQT